MKEPQILQVPFGKIQPWGKNPRTIKTEDLKKLAESIKTKGQFQVLTCWQAGEMYETGGGNMRWHAMKNVLKYADDKPVWISLNFPTSEKEKIELSLLDNMRFGAYDEQALAELVYPHLEDIDMDGYKIDLGSPVSLKDIIEGVAPNLDGTEDEVPEIDDTPAVTKTGDLFTLGRHRLLCGDSTKAEDVARLMRGEKADLCLTDPPYGAGIEYATHEDTQDSLMKIIAGFFPIAKQNSALIAITSGINNMWHYERPDWTLCWFYAAGTGRTPWGFSAWQPVMVWGKDPKLSSGEGAHPDGFNWPMTKADSDERKQIMHVCPKPVSSWAKWIERLSSENTQLILDPFLGSGTTLIAAEKLNRTCYGIEIDPKYCDVIIKRYCDYTETDEATVRATREARP